MVGNYEVSNKWTNITNINKIIMEYAEEALNSSSLVSSSTHIVSDNFSLPSLNTDVDSNSPKIIGELWNCFSKNKSGSEESDLLHQTQNIRQSNERSEQSSGRNSGKLQNNKRSFPTEDAGTISSTVVSSLFSNTDKRIDSPLKADKRFKEEMNSQSGKCNYPSFITDGFIFLLITGMDYQYLNKYLEANKKFQKILMKGERNNCLRTKIIALFYLQNSYRKLIAYIKASKPTTNVEKYEQELMNICRKGVMLDVTVDESKSDKDNNELINHLVYQYEHIGRHKDALRICDLFFQHMKLPSNEIYLCMTYMSIGEAYLGLKNYEAALDHYRKAYKISIENKTSNTSNISYKLYEIFRHLNNNEEALIYIQEYLRYLHRKSQGRINAYKMIMELCMEFKNYRLGRKYARKYRTYCRNTRRNEEKQNAVNIITRFSNLLATELEYNNVSNGEDIDIREHAKPGMLSTVAENRIPHSTSTHFDTSRGCSSDPNRQQNLKIQSFKDYVNVGVRCYPHMKDLSVSDDRVINTGSFISPQPQQDIYPANLIDVEPILLHSFLGFSDRSSTITNRSEEIDCNLSLLRDNFHFNRNDIVDPIPEKNQMKEQDGNLDWKMKARKLRSDAELSLSEGNYELAIMHFDNYYNIHAENSDSLGKRDTCELIMKKLIQANCYEDAMRYASRWYIQSMKLADFIRTTKACEKINFTRSILNLSQLSADRIFAIHFIRTE